MQTTEERLIMDITKGEVTRHVLRGTHVKDMHVSTGIVFDLDQTLSGKKTSSSHYIGQCDYTEMMESAIMDRAETITDWLNNRNSDPRMTIISDELINSPIIGRGVRLENDKIKPYQTKVSALILQKDNGNPYGFIIKTMYPDIRYPNAIPWDKDLTGMLKLTHAYRNASPEQRLHLEQMVRPDDRPEKTPPGNRPVNQQIRAASADDRHAGAARRVMEKAEGILNRDGCGIGHPEL